MRYGLLMHGIFLVCCLLVVLFPPWQRCLIYVGPAYESGPCYPEYAGRRLIGAGETSPAPEPNYVNEDTPNYLQLAANLGVIFMSWLAWCLVSLLRKRPLLALLIILAEAPLGFITVMAQAIAWQSTGNSG